MAGDWRREGHGGGTETKPAGASENRASGPEKRKAGGEKRNAERNAGGQREHPPAERCEATRPAGYPTRSRPTVDIFIAHRRIRAVTEFGISLPAAAFLRFPFPSARGESSGNFRRTGTDTERESSRDARKQGRRGIGIFFEKRGEESVASPAMVYFGLLAPQDRSLYDPLDEFISSLEQ